MSSTTKNDFKLKIAGVYYKGWQNVNIKKDITSLVDSFSTTILDDISIAGDDKIEIYQNDVLVLTGYVDNIQKGISDKRQPLQINGRSLASDLIDCNIAETKQFIKNTPKEIINKIMSPYGLKADTDIELETIAKFNTKIGDTVFDTINRICKQTNILPISTPAGGLKLIRNTGAKGKRTYKNDDFKNIQAPIDFKKRYSEYRVVKENAKNDDKSFVLKDDRVKRYKPLLVVNTEDKTNKELAKWHLNKNKADEMKLTAVVVGWELQIGTIIDIDTDVVKGSFLIKEATYTKDNNGTQTSISLVSKELFGLEND